jgi:hypothetical protein
MEIKLTDITNSVKITYNNQNKHSWKPESLSCCKCYFKKSSLELQFCLLQYLGFATGRRRTNYFKPYGRRGRGACLRCIGFVFLASITTVD